MRPYFLLFGDSITQFSLSTELRGWGGLLADYYTAKVDIINRGFSGYTTRVATLLLDKVFPLNTNELNPSVLQANPSLITIFFGANDCCHSPSPQHVPLSEYEANLTAIVAHAKMTCPNVVVITPPPFEPSMWKIFCEVNKKPSTSQCRTNESAGQYAQAAVRVASAQCVHCVDLWTLAQQEPDWRQLLVDGLHLSHEGNAFLFRKLRELILSDIKSISPAQLALYNNEGILWSEIDLSNPRNSIKM